MHDFKELLKSSSFSDTKSEGGEIPKILSKMITLIKQTNMSRYGLDNDLINQLAYKTSEFLRNFKWDVIINAPFIQFFLINKSIVIEWGIGLQCHVTTNKIIINYMVETQSQICNRNFDSCDENECILYILDFYKEEFPDPWLEYKGDFGSS
jgi:hypothetical protein